MDMMDRIIDSYNELVRCQVGPLPENIKHPMITDEEAKEPCWMQITKTEWEALQPLRCSAGRAGGHPLHRHSGLRTH